MLVLSFSPFLVSSIDVSQSPSQTKLYSLPLFSLSYPEARL
jgi:hypothetical protein